MDSITRQGAWPDLTDFIYYEEMEILGDHAITVLTAIRKYKSDNKMSIKTPIKTVIYGGLQLSIAWENNLKDTGCVHNIMYDPEEPGIKIIN